jgi:hypothetical protein
LFKDEYDTAIRIIVSVKDGDVLVQLMNAYLSLYGRYSANKNNIHFYRSDQVFQLLIEQSVKVSDESLFEIWDGFLTGPSDSANSFKNRFAELSPTSIDAFRKSEKEKRRNRRSILDLLKDEYTRRVGRKPKTNDELYDFDPRPGVTQTLLEDQITAVKKPWNAVRGDYTKENAENLDSALIGFNKYVQWRGKKDLLSLFQAIKQLQGPFRLEAGSICSG